MLKYSFSKEISKKKRLSLKQRKALIREKVKTLIKRLSQDERKRKSLLIEKKLEALEPFRKAEKILFYWPLPGEPDIKNLIRKAKREGKVVALPLIKGKDIRPYKFTSFRDLVKGPWEILQPKEKKSLRLSLRELDLVFVPGLAFDKKNRRLGRGKGYYDRLLKRLPSKTLKIGIGFDCQVLRSLPFSLQDQRVDLVVWA